MAAHVLCSVDNIHAGPSASLLVLKLNVAVNVFAAAVANATVLDIK